MAGLPAGQADINRVCGNAIVALANALHDCSDINAMINDTSRGFGSSGLALLGFNAAEITLLLNSFADLQNLYKVAHGQQQQIGNSNFFFNAANLMGVNPLH